MTSLPPISDDLFEKVSDLALAALSGEATPRELEQLDEMVRTSEDACRVYVDVMLDSYGLRKWSGAADLLSHGSVTTPAPGDSSLLPAAVQSTPVGIGFLGTAYHGTVDFFSQEVPFAILMATLFMAVGGLIGSVMTVEHYTQMPGQSQPSSSDSFASNASADNTIQSEEEVKWVGRITGMVDCRWSDDKDFLPPGNDYVSLGRKYKLDAGLMEITYYTGAKVILQGPVTYEVESNNGGYMSLGKLTGKVEVEKAKGFSVRTPTATVTDLGTEFGVEVKSDRLTEFYVFRGVVETTRIAGAGGTPVRERLVAGEAIRYVSGDALPHRTTVKLLRAAPLPSTAEIHAAVREARQSRLLAPAALVATAYHRVWDAQGKLLADNDRRLAFEMATDGVYGRGEKGEGPRSSFDTALVASGQWQVTSKQPLSAENQNSSHSSLATSHQPLATNFVGLLYGRPVRIDRIKVFLGHQFADGGSLRQTPRIFIQTKPDVPVGTPPENDPDHWRELSTGQIIYGAPFAGKTGANPGEVIEFLLANTPEADRIGYGWAISGAKAEDAGYLSITELRGYGEELKKEEDNGGTPIPAVAQGAVLASETFDEYAVGDSPGVAHYTMGGNVNDRSDNALDGTAQNGPSYGTGQFGQAINLASGSHQYVTVADDAAFHLNAFTVSLWVNPVGVGASGTGSLVNTRNWLDLKTFDILLFSDLQTIHADIGDGTNWLTTSADYTAPSALFGWNMITYTVASSGYVIYLNGSQVASGSVGGGTPLFMGGGELSFGSFANKAEYLSELDYYGGLDDIRIYNRVLSSTEVRALYTAVPEPKMTSMLLCGPCPRDLNITDDRTITQARGETQAASSAATAVPSPKPIGERR